MKHTNIIVCPKCGCDDLRKNGHGLNGTQRWSCKGCHKFFQLEFKQQGRLPEVKAIHLTTLLQNRIIYKDNLAKLKHYSKMQFIYTLG